MAKQGNERDARNALRLRVGIDQAAGRGLGSPSSMFRS